MTGAKDSYQVNEIFWSIQGEGSVSGRTSIFIRLQGCPVGCPWCDSKLTWYAGGTKMSIDDLYDAVLALPVSDLIVVTGGEPCIWDLDPLMRMLQYDFGHRKVQLETSGARAYQGRIWPDLIVISPKLAANWYIDPQLLYRADELKYVVDDDFTPEVVRRHFNLLMKTGRAPSMSSLQVYLMPEGSPPRPEMVEKTISILREYPQARFSPRLQYAYPEIGKLEGKNNVIISKQQAREQARALRGKA